MGEMIGNIAHQWRQPLNTLALLIQPLELDAQGGAVDGRCVSEFSAQSMEVLERMSTTKVEFSVEALMASSFSFVEPAFKNSSIEVIVEKDQPGALLGYQNKLSQVLLRILNNAREVLEEKNPPRKLVRIWLSGQGETQ